MILIIAVLGLKPVMAQEAGVSVKGIVLESGTGLPLKQVSVSVASTGKTADTDEKGSFTITVPDKQAELIINLPGYNKRNIYLNGRDFLTISLVSSDYNSFDNSFNSPLGSRLLKDASFTVSKVTAADFNNSSQTSFDQELQGRVPGLSVTEQSGMPGHKAYLNIRGFSSLYGKSEPLMIIDGMIHDYTYANNSLIEGFSVNPLEVVDLEDITDITVLKDGTGFLGAAGANGAININTEQKSEASTIIKMTAYTGVSFAPQALDVLNPTQFKSLFADELASQGYNQSQINTKYPWLNGSSGSDGYYRYNNNTNWQDLIYKPATLQKYHFFLKGGDDIATYNISTGYLKQQGMFDESAYSRFNLRINGKINITEKFSIAPNAKLSLADYKVPNLGPSAWKSPIMAALQKSPLMGPYAKDESNGLDLPYLDDIGAFNISNPKALVDNATGSNRNYHFLSSVDAQYKFSERLILATLVGIDFNNSRENIFLPDNGVVQIDSAANSPGDFVNEYRSSQNHTYLVYNTKTKNGHSLMAQGGFRYMKNTYKYDQALDLNTPSDDFKSLGQGSKYSFLRTAVGDSRGLVWISYYGSANYSFRNKYFLSGNVSYDGNSAVNKNNRYNFFPSVAAAWRVSSEKFLSSAKWIDDMKFRGAYSVAGNMFSSIYDYSKLYYTSTRINSMGVIVREAIPNENLELEKKTTVSGGIDLSLFKQVANIHVDFYKSSVDNLIIGQELPESVGFTHYFDNGGKLESKGVEVSADTRVHFGNVIWTLGASVTKQNTEITDLKFIKAGVKDVITPIEGGEYITSVGNAVNAFYGYKTEGIFTSSSDADQYIGPKGTHMQAGDVKFVDVDGNKTINAADKQIIGDPNPDLFGGISTSLSYKNFSLSAFFNYSVGNDIYNYVKYRSEAMDSYANQSIAVLDRWSDSNTGGKLPRAAYGDPSGNAAFSDRWIEDGSYLRLKQLTVSYTLPSLSGVYKGITIYATGTNLLTFTKYSGYDPDFLYSNNPFYMGVDYGKMPQNKSFIIGLKLDL